MGEGVAPHDGFVGLNGHVHQTRHHATRRIDLRRVDVGADVKPLMAFQDHSYLFKGSVAGTFADAVNGYLGLTGTVQHTRHGVGGCHAKVIMAMGGDNGVLYTSNMVAQILDLSAILSWKAVAGGVGNIDNCGTGLHNCLDHTGQILVLRTACILGIELHIIHKTTGILHSCHSTLDDLFTIAVELVLDVGVGGADTRMDTLALGVFQGFHRHVNVFLDSTCQSADGGPSHGF